MYAKFRRWCLYRQSIQYLENKLIINMPIFSFFLISGQLNYKLTIYYEIFKLFGLISKCLLLQNVTIKPSGQTTKVSDSICSVPVDTFDVTNLLPRPVYSNTIVIKSKIRISE